MNAITFYVYNRTGITYEYFHTTVVLQTNPFTITLITSEGFLEFPSSYLLLFTEQRFASGPSEFRINFCMKCTSMWLIERKWNGNSRRDLFAAKQQNFIWSTETDYFSNILHFKNIKDESSRFSNGMAFKYRWNYLSRKKNFIGRLCKTLPYWANVFLLILSSHW